LNNGQSCIAAKRFIVHRAIADEFERRFVDKMRALKVGEPMADTTEIGPLATAELLQTLEKQVNETLRMGALLLLGGKRLERPGFFYSPTVLTNVPTDSPAIREELFGPVAALFRVNDLDEALRIANDTCFGLGSCLWTEDHRERDEFIERIEAGLAFVNGMVVSDPRLPFGGVKQSGYGRELGAHGIREFVNVKTVVVHEAASVSSAKTE
jgi:succinate-semialdehyde dehydrogenase/glutarate-semialdehyde dehydrogenase